MYTRDGGERLRMFQGVRVTTSAYCVVYIDES